MITVLEIDEKWSIEVDTANNDAPLRVLRYKESWGPHNIDNWTNLERAMYYRLLEIAQNKSIDNPPESV